MNAKWSFLPAIMLSAATVCGCLNPMTTRLPTLGLPPEPVERTSLERFDPFADPDLGPDTESRPRAFQQNLDNQRRQFGTNVLGPASTITEPRLPSAEYQYPNSVH